MKLLVDTKHQRVLYAQAGKDVVDFLLSLLSLPIATAVKLMGQDSVAGSVGNLYASAVKLDDTYAAGDAHSLQPDKVVRSDASNKDGFLYRLLPSAFKPAARSMKYFRCSGSIIHWTLLGRRPNGLLNPCGKYVTDTHGMTCPSCRNRMNMEVEFLSSQGSSQSVQAAAGHWNGAVQRAATYTVTDNLQVAPMSATAGITLLKTFGVTDIGVLEEKTVQFGYSEVTHIW